MNIPKTMKAAVLFGSNDLRVVERDVPVPEAREVLIKVKACAICGTDPKILAHGWQNMPPFGEYIPGHEFTGEVVALGDTVDEFKVGDRVAVETHKGCGTCENCLKGAYTNCFNYGNKEKGHRHYGFTVNGGYAEYVVMHINVVHHLPDNVSFDEGTLATTGGTVLYGYETVGDLNGGETVVVSGPGAIGLMAVEYAKMRGASKVILTGTRESRLKIGRELGADVTINVREEKDVTKKIMEETELGRGADVFIECSGSKDAIAMSIDVMKKCGRILFVGFSPDLASMDMKKFTLMNLSAYGTRGEGAQATGLAVKLIGQGKLTAKSLVTHSFPLNEINKAFDTFVNRVGGAIKVLVKP